jgi:hypothetical protein
VGSTAGDGGGGGVASAESSSRTLSRNCWISFSKRSKPIWNQHQLGHGQCVPTSRLVKFGTQGQRAGSRLGVGFRARLS